VKAKLVKKYTKNHMRLKYKAQRTQARNRMSWFVKNNEDVELEGRITC